MEIPEQLTVLAELSRIEGKAKEMRDRLNTVPLKVNEAQVVVDELEKKWTDVDVKRDLVEKDRRQLEMKLASERDQLKKWNARADKIRDEREHGALMSEISGAKRAITHLENDILERMQELENFESEQKKLLAAKESATSTVQEETEKVKDEIAELESALKTSNGARDALAQKLPVTLLKRYERIAEKRGQGVALIARETCLACQRMLPPQLHILVYKGAVIEQCPSCARILVHEAMTQVDGGETSGPAA